MKILIAIGVVLSLLQFTESVLRGMKPFWINRNDLGFSSKSRDQRWADAVYNYLHNLDCDHSTFTNTQECEKLIKLPQHSMSVYMAPTSSYGRYVVTLPDERLTRSSAHDAVLVLDPYPMASFGHVLLIFLVDLSVSRTQCQDQGGIYLDHDECMHMALRRRCKNMLERRSRRRNFARRCEINFLPRVSLDSDRGPFPTNHLTCRSDLTGFHACRKLRAANETSRLLCDPLIENSQTCATTHETIRTSCRVYEICDQAVLLSGGWNRLINEVTSQENIVAFYQLLRRNGYKRRNIKIFFANGIKDIQIPGESNHTAHPAAMKLAIRYHLQRMCGSPKCLDTLFLYLNSPANHHGDMLLWDVNQDGLAEESEKYTVDELLSDLSECAARQVYVLADQSYSGEIGHAVRTSSHHNNVVVLSSGRGSEYSTNNQFSRFWAARDNTRACVTDEYQKSLEAIENSTPILTNPGHVKTTLSGAPCDVTPPFSSKELRRDHFGCQNLPTAVWLNEILRQTKGDAPKNHS